METSGMPKYIQIRDELVTRIKSGQLKTNSAIPSYRELAEEFAVSRYTAIKAVKELEKEGLVFHEQGKGTFVSPPISLQGNEFKKTYKIGVVISNLAFVGLPYLNRVLKGINEELTIYGYNLVLFGLTGVQDSKTFSLEEIVEKGQVDALLVDDNVSTKSIVFLCQKGVPFVQLGSDVGKVEGYNYSRVVIDMETIIHQAVRYLFENGRRRIAFVQGTISAQPKDNRVWIFREAMQFFGLEVKEEYLCYGKYGEESGSLMAKEFFWDGRHLDAIITNEDMLALGVVKEAREQGISIPEELMVVGLGDYLLDSFLTTFRVPGYEMGSEAARLLIQKLQPEQEVKTYLDRVLLPELIIRET